MGSSGLYPTLSEAERFPLLSPAGRQLLHALREHPQAPMWNWPNGEQLDGAGLENVQRFAAALNVSRPPAENVRPAWLAEFTAFCLTEVPFYRRRSLPGTNFDNVPSCSRADVAPQVWDFVPDRQPLDELIVFSSSGTTGFPTRTPTHPATAACGLPLIEAALASTGIHFPRGAEQMALSNVVAYRGAYTTAIVMAYLEEAGCIRVNLVPDAWRTPHDASQYLDRFWSPVMLGDPQAFAALANVDIQRPPQVLVSSIMHLSDGLANQLTARYGCPVIDLYALTEAGIVAVKTERGHRVLPHDLYVEILDEHDEACPAGVRGEITLTGGRNPFLPLLRYRTGDYASLAWHDGHATLVGLEGRQPVCFPTTTGVVHSMEVTRLVRQFPIVRYQLYQDAVGGFTFSYRGFADASELKAALFELLEKPARLEIAELPAALSDKQKSTVYVSDHPAAAASLR
jgi:phenylacetate-CoA ligase